jgi:hypothetical protein
MKHKNLKSFAFFILIASLASCKVDESITANQTQTKTENENSMYEFNTKQYYHNGKLLSDTAQIKNLLYDAQVVYEDTTGRRTIFDSEEKYTNYVGGSKISQETDDLAKTEFAYNPDNDTYSINSIAAATPQEQEKDHRLMIYSMKARMPDGKNRYFNVSGPLYYPTVFGRYDIFDKNSKYVGNIKNARIFTDIMVQGSNQLGSLLRIRGHNPSRYKKRVFFWLTENYVNKQNIKLLVKDVLPKGRFTIYSIKLSSSGPPNTAGMKGFVYGHFSKTIE